MSQAAGPVLVDLAALDEMLDNPSFGRPKYIWVPEHLAADFWEHLRQWPLAADLGYSDVRGYRRALADASAAHGPRLQRRLELAIAEHYRKRRKG